MELNRVVLVESYPITISLSALRRDVNVNVNVRCVQPVGHVVRAALDPRGVRAAGGGRGAVGVRAARAGDHESGGPLVSARLGSAPPEGLLRPQLRVRRASFPHPLLFSPLLIPQSSVLRLKTHFHVTLPID